MNGKSGRGLRSWVCARLSSFTLILLSAMSATVTAPCNAQHNQGAVILMSEELDAKGKLLPLAQHVQGIFFYLEKHSGLKLEVRRYPWKRALDMAINGEGIIFGISKTAEREKSLIFSSPLFTDKVYLVTRCDQTFKYQQIGDLRGKVIGLVRGTSYGAEFDSQIGKVFQVEADTGSNAGRLRKLYQKRMDAFLLYSILESTRLAEQINLSYAQEFPDATKSAIFCVLPNPVSQVSIHLAIAKHSMSDQFLSLELAVQKGRQSDDYLHWFSKTQFNLSQ